MSHRNLGLAVLILALFSITSVFAQDAPVHYQWKDAAIGAPAPAGSHTWDNKALTITGSGAGLNLDGIDRCGFVYIDRAAGDFEIIARLANFTGSGNATAGIMARPDNAPTGAMAAVFFKAKDNSADWISRIPGTPAQVFSSAIQLARNQPIEKPAVLDPEDAAVPAQDSTPVAKPPLWLRMVRMGASFAVYKSRDGVLWSMISNVSGGPLSLDGPLELGFFATGTADKTPVSATFDSIETGAARMRYKTSWAGNSFGGRGLDSHVSNALSAMWVAPDGTCYASSYWDEGGRPVTSYRNGKVGRTLPIGTPQTAEGGIAGDDKHLFVATNDRISMLDPAAPDFAPLPLPLSVNLIDKKSNDSVVGGMASNGSDLFVADTRDNLIRVVTQEPITTFQVAEGANDAIALAPLPVTLPAPEVGIATETMPDGDVVPDAAAEKSAPYAPAIIYQSRRIGEAFRYTVPGLAPGAQYTVRCHFAEYAPRSADKRIMNVGNVPVNVFDLAGGILKAFAKDFPGYKADANGNITIHFSGHSDSGVCGIEILNVKGERVFAINCGGPTVGDFKGESPELVTKDFPFERPGPMTIDKRGDLWIVRRGNDFPIGGGVAAKYPAAVKCYKTDGTFTGRVITDVVNPRALGYDAAKDQLIVGENGPDLDVRFYSGLEIKPVLAKTFGAKGGIYSGAHPGQVNDPASGGLARFAGISGVGVDSQGNLYVGGGFQGTDLRMFTPDGKLGWMLNSLMFCNTYDFDPDSDGSEIYGAYNHLHLDLSKTAPGAEQTYIGYNWDLRKYGDPDRAGNSQSIVRRLGPDKRLLMFTSGQGTVGDIKIFRYDGEIAVPAGDIGDSGMWIDANGDGKEQPEEIDKTAKLGWCTCLQVDSHGDIWAATGSTGGSVMRHYFFKGLNAGGVPIYSGVKGAGYVDIPFPEEGAKTSAWGMSCRMDYDPDRDILVAFYPAVARKGENDKSPPQYFMARYDNWSKGNQTPTWKVKAFDPIPNPEYFMYEVNPYPYRCYMGIQVVGDYVFFAYVFGQVHVFDLKTGKLSEILAMGPEVNGSSAWEDSAMGLRAFKTKSGEYLVLTENSGWGGKCNLFRWRP